MGLFIQTIGIARAATKIGMANLVYGAKRLLFLRRTAEAWRQEGVEIPVYLASKAPLAECGSRSERPRRLTVIDEATSIEPSIFFRFTSIPSHFSSICR